MSRQGKLSCNLKIVLSLLYLSCDLNFVILTFFSTSYFSHLALLVSIFELMLRHKRSTLNFTTISIYSLPFKTTTTQLIYIMQKFSKFHYASHSAINHQNKNKNSPKLSIMLYQRQIEKFKSRRKRKLPLFGLLC